MAVKLNSYIHFADNARQAAEFYHAIFGGELQLDTMGSYDSPEMPVASGDKDKVMHVYVKGENGIGLMLADTPTGMGTPQGSRMSLTLNGNDEALLMHYWDKLAAGGTVTVPMGPSPWGDTFGMLTDKYGVDWMVDYDPKA